MILTDKEIGISLSVLRLQWCARYVGLSDYQNYGADASTRRAIIDGFNWYHAGQKKLFQCPMR